MAVYLNCNVENGKPAARLGDSVGCPKHGTASIVSGSPTMRHNGEPAARVGDKTSCGATIIEGSNSVHINGKPAAFIGCATTHGGKIISGSPTVFIGKTEAGADLDKHHEQFSMSVDFNQMHEAGSYNNISYDLMAVEITKPDGTYLTTTSTDEHGVTNRFYTEEQEEVVAWADFGLWDVSEEFEFIDAENVEEVEYV